MSDRIKVNFLPGCFDHFDGSQEELDAMIAEIEAWANGESELSCEVVDINNFDGEVELSDFEDLLDGPKILH
jgi:hypothetical protein